MRFFWIRRHISLAAVAAAILVLLAGCNLGANLPDVQNHPQPTLGIIEDAPWDSGCPQNETKIGCPPESPLGMLGCDSIQAPGDMLGGLSPQYPVNICLARREPGQGMDDGTFLYREGCMVSTYVRYAVWRDGNFEIIQSLADMKMFYAPVDSPEEALSYAIAATGLGVRYGLEPNRSFRYFVDEVQDTHVIAVEDGYKVLLYDYKLCGCGPHTTEAVVIHVTTDGQLQEVSRQAVYEDPAEDDLCID